MAWVKTSHRGVDLIAQEAGVTLPASATTEYSTVIPFMGPNGNQNRYISVLVSASTVSGTNLDIQLHGAMTPTGSKFLLKDTIVTDVTNGVVQGGVIDLNAYPAPYYFVSWTADANESANTITVTLFIPGAA